VAHRRSKKKTSKAKDKRHRRSSSGTRENSRFGSELDEDILLSLVTNARDRASILNINPNQWLLPETKQFLEGDDPPKQPTEDPKHPRTAQGRFQSD
jgi:hypothetical protein